MTRAEVIDTFQFYLTYLKTWTTPTSSGAPPPSADQLHVLAALLTVATE